MSLDTILKIGKILRHGSKDPMKHYRYLVEPKENDNLVYITIPVRNDMSFDFSGIKIIPQNKKDSLYYLRYKTSDSDSSAAKYMFGDIFYKIEKSFDKKGKIKAAKESGNYILQKSNAFSNAEKTRDIYIKEFVNNISELSSKEKKIFKTDISKVINLDKDTSEIAENFVKDNTLLFFWKKFAEYKQLIEQILLYAPLFEFSPSFEDLSNRYIKYVFENKYSKIKSSIANKKSIDELNEIEKKKLLDFADHSVFIHFEFEPKEQWYQQTDVFEIITNTLNKELTTGQNGNSLVPTSSIYRTLCSGNDKNDIQFPSFDFKNSYKSFAFKDMHQFNDFLYANAIINQPRMWIKGTNINIYVFPVSFDGQEIDADSYEAFFFDNRSENSLFSFNFLNGESNEKFMRFDFVFSDSGGNTTKDLIEISGIERSKLVAVRDRINKIERNIAKRKEDDLGRTNVTMNLEKSFTNIFGKITLKDKGSKKEKNNEKDVIFDNTTPQYQYHMLKVLPLIYNENYYNELNALSNLVNKVEYLILHNIKTGNYVDLKYDFMLIMNIQNNQKNKYMEITNSESYQLGLMLGALAKELRDKINSFEKNYVGNLTRRISTLSDFIKLKTDIEQKLIMHEKSKYTFQISYDLSQKVKEFKSQYDKEECAFGFMESYFKPYPKNDKKELTENQVENN